MLDTVGMVSVDIHIGDPAQPRCPQRQDRKDGVVQIAEPVRSIGKPVMRAACRTVNDTRIPEQLACKDRRACRSRRSPEHLGEDRI